MRWQRVWLAEQSGAALPPISVVPIGGEYVLRDGHHRVSVAKARGALTIDARLDDTLVI
jgi:ParB-like chromosome segregation protein Spo0J